MIKSHGGIVMGHLSTILTTICLMWATSAATEPALGVWKSEPGETGGYIHVEIMPCENNLCGIIIEVVGNDNRSIIGRNIINDMKIKGNGKYNGGKIWAPDTDKTYRSHMTLDEDVLTVSGCVAMILCRGQKWTRLK